MFGTMGAAGWIIAIFVLFGLFCLALDKIGKMIKEDKELKAKGEKPKNADTIVFLVIIPLIILGIAAYNTFFGKKYHILYRFNEQSQWAIDVSLDPKSETECKNKASSLNTPNAAFQYTCAKNCEKDGSGIYISKCEEIY